MSRLRVARMGSVLGLIVLTAWGCNSDTPTDPGPTYPQKTEVFEGAIAPGETKAFSFSVENPGELQAAITSLSPISTLTMGLQLGGWDVTNQTCSKTVSSDAARLNLVLSGTPQNAGVYCVAIYDVGNLQGSTDFGLTVLHY